MYKNVPELFGIFLGAKGLIILIILGLDLFTLCQIEWTNSDIQ